MTSNYKLDTCVWELTLRCCFSCIHCGSRAGLGRENELSKNEALGVVRQLINLQCRRVVLIGGEVFLYSGWESIAAALTSHGVHVSIVTNSFLLSENIYLQLKKAGIPHICISIDGTQEIHDHLRQVGSYTRAIEAIHELRHRGFSVSVITTISKYNISALPELYKVLNECGIQAWQLQACSPMGNASDVMTLTQKESAQVIDFVTYKAFSAPFLVGIADNIGYFTAGEGFIRGSKTGKAIYSGCQAGISSIGIDSVGNVRGCESLYDDKFIEGNLRQRSLVDIWHDSNSFAYNRHFDKKMLTGKCSTCQYAQRCRGGCRSMNYFVHDNLYESQTCVMDTMKYN